MALTEAQKILKAGLTLTPLTKGNQAIIFLMMETEEQIIKMARFIVENKQATEKELMAEAQRIATE